MAGRIRAITMSDTLTPAPVDITAHAVRVLTLYSLAEFQSGQASTIGVSAEGTSFSVGDNGRGHAVDRTVDGSPYLQFIYTHLEYPFAAVKGGPVQLHGIGISLLNALCSELSVTVHRAGETLRIMYRAGHLYHEERLATRTNSTGNTVSGIVSPHLQQVSTNIEHIEGWLLDVLASSPGHKLHLNGKELHAPRANAA